MLDQPLTDRLRAAREAQTAPEAAPAPEGAAEPALPERVPLGRLLVERGALSEADLEIALARQQHEDRPLGQILLEMGAVSDGDLARTLTEQHGFDFNASLRRRLASVDEQGSEPEPVEALAHEQESELEPLHGERYVVRESGVDEPLHVADSFLDAADAAFELIEERDPDGLEIVRTGTGEVEQLWSYRRDEAGGASSAV